MITPPAKAPRQKRVSFAVLLLFILLGWWFFFVYQRPVSAPEIVPIPVTARGDLAADEQSTIALFRAASPAVVYITSIEVRRNIFSLNIHEIPQGSGSGFIWDKQGRVVTNYHVIEAASRVEVTLADRSTWQATLVGVAPDKDLAVLQISAPAEKLTPLPLGESHNLLVGQKVFAIGNPFGLDQSLTSGIVSALGREIQSATGRTIQGVIQTDAAINKGNSGGPLLNLAGEVVGINTATVLDAQNIGFAIPADKAKRGLEQVKSLGKIVYPFLGIEYRLVNKTVQQEQNLPVDYGVLVRDVVAESSAAKAGVLAGDIILEFNGERISQENSLADIIQKYDPGDAVVLKVLRNKQEKILNATLGERSE